MSSSKVKEVCHLLLNNHLSILVEITFRLAALAPRIALLLPLLKSSVSGGVCYANTLASLLWPTPSLICCPHSLQLLASL